MGYGQLLADTNIVEAAVAAGMSVADWEAAHPELVAEYEAQVAPEDQGFAQEEKDDPKTAAINLAGLQAALEKYAGLSAAAGNPIPPQIAQDLGQSYQDAGTPPPAGSFGTPPSPPGTSPGTSPSPAAPTAPATGTTPPEGFWSLFTDLLELLLRGPTGFPAWVQAHAPGVISWTIPNVFAPVQAWTKRQGAALGQLLFGQPTITALNNAAQTIDLITSTSTTTEVKAVVGQINNIINHPTTIKDRMVGFVLRLTALPAVFASYLDPIVKAVNYDSNFSSPQNVLATQDLVKLVQRNYMLAGDAAIASQYNGDKITDFATLQALALAVTDPQTALDWFAKGLISQPELNGYMQAAGIATYDQGLLEANALKDQDALSTINISGKQAAAAAERQSTCL